MLSDAQGIPLAVAVSGANTHDSLALKPLIRGIPAVRSRRTRTRSGDPLTHDAAPEKATERDTEFWIRAADGREVEVDIDAG